MYVVIDKKTRGIIHANPAPLSQSLDDKDIYYKFDPKKMDIGRTDGALPEHFEVNKKGEIVELSLAKKIKAGIIELTSEEKMEGDRIVEKTLSEKVADGLMELRPDQKLDGDEVKTLSNREMLDEGKIDLKEYKKKMIERFSRTAFERRIGLLPDYKLQNASLGIYDQQTMAKIKATIEAFRDEFHRIEGLIKKAKSAKAIDAIKEKYPKEIIIKESPQ